MYIALQQGQIKPREWRQKLDVLLGKLWDVFISPIHTCLTTIQAEKIIFMPQGGLGLMPLHAAWRMVDGQKRFWLDDYEISFTPSMQTLQAAQRRLSRLSSAANALVAGVSQYKQLSNLSNTAIEAQVIAEIFKSEALINEQVTLQAIIAQSETASYLHLACHGGFSWNDPLNSALYLTEDAPLTLSDILTKLDLDVVRLVTLSACETGIVQFNESPDEYLGLPAGFIQAGAPAVISSLWTVEDRSTALLMERFYQLHLVDGLSPAAALRASQQWLRNLTRREIGEYYQAFIRMSAANATDAYLEVMSGASTDKPYNNPFYWAAFTYTGI
jgi:CHAT domain-containing protein